ncbi:MAG: cardiolipin synthase A, partial [Polynucleobacter sp. 17-46-58]
MNIINFLLGSIFGESFIWVPILHIVVVILFGYRLISVRRPVGVVLAWFLIVVLFPLIGISLYILIGERPVGRKLTRKIIRMDREYAAITETMRQRHLADRAQLPPEGRALSLLAESKNGSPVTAGNQIQLFTNSLDILQDFINEINQAQHTLYLEFYIWALGGDADRVGEALIAAA